MNYLGFAPDKIGAVSTSLNGLLADYQVYYQNLRNYHWNIAGEHFYVLHEQFEVLYNKAKVNIDEIAERVLTLRQKPMSTLADYLDTSKVKEESTDDPLEMVQSILGNHKTLIRQMRVVITDAGKAEDEGTIDLIGGFLADLEKDSWMLDAWANRE